MPEDKPRSTTALRSAVARRITALRRQQGLSLSVLAARAGVGKGTLSELEAGTRNATLETLYALAGPLGVPLTGLVGDEAGGSISDEVVDVRLLTVTRHDDGGVTEVFWLTIAARGTRTSPPHGAGVREHLRVVRGTALVGPTGDERAVGAGESWSWGGGTAHSYSAVGGVAEAVLTIETPAPAPGPAQVSPG